MSPTIQVPISDEQKYNAIMDELSMSEIQSAIASKYNEKVETIDEGKDGDELAQYDRMADIHSDDSLTEAERKRRVIKARRKGLPR
jgi:hypothetical protein